MAGTIRMTLAEALDRPSTADRQRLDATTEADIRRFQAEDGYDPDADLFAQAQALPAPQAVRALYDLSQAAFADWIGVPVATWRNWEQGRTTPDPAARTLLAILAREPEAARRALGEARKAAP